MAQKPLSQKSEAPLCAGHRQRLREKMLASNILPDTVYDYEVLEFLLSLAIPRKDVKVLAKTLLTTFHDLGGVLSAEPSDLMAVSGIKETTVAAIKAAYLCSQRVIKNRILKQPLINCWDKLIDYCHTTYGFAKQERVAVLYIDAKGHLMLDAILNCGTVDQTFFYPQEVLRQALALGSCRVILVHNHPSGSTEPSSADIELTQELQTILSKTGITLDDHIIVSPKSYFSFKAKGLL